jgi:hypothetical protein
MSILKVAQNRKQTKFGLLKFYGLKDWLEVRVSAP